MEKRVDDGVVRNPLWVKNKPSAGGKTPKGHWEKNSDPGTKDKTKGKIRASDLVRPYSENPRRATEGWKIRNKGVKKRTENGGFYEERYGPGISHVKGPGLTTACGQQDEVLKGEKRLGGCPRPLPISTYSTNRLRSKSPKKSKGDSMRQETDLKPSHVKKDNATGERDGPKQGSGGDQRTPKEGWSLGGSPMPSQPGGTNDNGST